jgi:type II secretory pathway component PulK
MPRPFLQSSSRRRAVMLILTMWIVLVLTLLAHSLAFEMQVEVKLTSSYRDRFKAAQLARIGIARAITDLRNDRLLERTDNEDSGPLKQFDGLGDTWTDSTMLPREYVVDAPRGRDIAGHYDLLVIDEESKIPLRSEGKLHPETLMYLLMQLDVEEQKARDIANAIEDWRDENQDSTDPNFQNEQAFFIEMNSRYGEARSKRRVRGSFSRRRSNEPETETPSRPKNAPFDTVDELLHIPGITPEIFYGYDPEEETEIEFFPQRTRDDRPEHPVGLRDFVTTRAEKMNINTASFHCLAAALAVGPADLQKGEEQADRIIDHRQGRGDDDIDNENAFRDLSQLAKIEGLGTTVLGQLRQAVPLTVTSDNFTIYCRAAVGEKRERVRVSRRRHRGPRETQPATIVAECHRKVLPYPIFLDDNGGELLAETLPGYRAPYSSHARANDRTAQMAPEEVVMLSKVTEAWYVPVVYFDRWNSY